MSFHETKWFPHLIFPICEQIPTQKGDYKNGIQKGISTKKYQNVLELAVATLKTFRQRTCIDPLDPLICQGLVHQTLYLKVINNHF
jgi:hypothetical protein